VRTRSNPRPQGTPDPDAEDNPQVVLTMHDACSVTGLTQDTLRYWEKQELLDQVGRTATGQRRYTRTDIASIRVLQRLKASGMSIAEMREFAHLRREGPASLERRLGALIDHRGRLDAQLRVVDQWLSVADSRISHYRLVIADRHHES